MSVLSLPRFVFQGTTSWNPNTVNNSSVTYDENAPAPQFHPPPVTASTYDTWLKTYVPSAQNLPGSWNVYGDQGCNMVNATVTGIQLASGPDAQDPLLGQPVQMVGQSYFPSDTPPQSRMVDIDPYSPYTTQIFYRSISIGDTTVGVTGPGVVRMFSRWPNMSRNLNTSGTLIIAGSMGVLWQATVAADQLTWYGLAQSPALTALKTAIEQGGQGLAVLFASYRTLYFTQATWNGQPITNPQQLSQAYLAGFTGGNPAVSVALGTIGVWGPGELASAPTERALLPATALIPSGPVTSSAPAATTRKAQEARAPQTELAAAAPQPVQLGTAFARVDTSRNVVTLDFLGTFPEQDASLAKADFGTFELQAVPAAGPPVTLGQPLTSAQYAQAAYEAGSGIVDFTFEPYQADLVENGLLRLVQTGTNSVALQESALLAETDQRGVYVDQGQTQQVTIQVYQRGVTPPSGSVEVLLVNYANGGGVPTNPVPPSASILELVDAQGNPLPDPPVLQVGANGSATFGIRSRQPGIGWVFFLPYPAGTTPPTPPTGLHNLQEIPDSYLAVRALAFDNALFNKPDSELTWDYIYENVLQTYNLVYPLMSLILNLGDETTVDQNAAKIEYATSLHQFLTTLFMPITREMSAGKRDVLQRYLRLQQGGG